MPSLQMLLLKTIRPDRLFRVGGLVACLFLPSAVFGQLQSNPLDVDLDGVPDLMESFQYFGGGTSASVSVHRAVYPDNGLLSPASGVGGFEMGSSLDGNLETASFPSVSSSGYFGFRFRAADGLHYGWFYAAQPLLPGGGFWPNFAGVTVRNFGYNPVPDAPFAVGAATPMVLKASVVGGRLRLSWNMEASPSGIRVESRALRTGGTWSLVQTVYSGHQLDVDLSGEGRIYRAIQN